MSMGSLGAVGSFATVFVQAKAAAADKAQRETADTARATAGERRAESAAGIGQTEQDTAASDRDADGRRLWENATAAAQEEPDASPAEEVPPPAIDPTGLRGSLLDVSG